MIRRNHLAPRQVRCELHAIADTEIRNVVFTGKLRSRYFAFEPAVAEAPGYQDAVHAFHRRNRLNVVERGLGFHLYQHADLVVGFSAVLRNATPA